MFEPVSSQYHYSKAPARSATNNSAQRAAGAVVVPSKQSQYKLEWWVVRKRSIYLWLALIVCVAASAGGFFYLWKHRNEIAVRKDNLPTGARFDSFEGDVRVVRAGTRETVMASSELGLEPGDIVQTQESGRARILLIDGSTLLVRPNSVVQIRDNTSSDGRATKVRVAVDKGLINVRTTAQGNEHSNVVETRLTQNHIAGETGASFAVREDNTEDIRVNSGSVETTTRDGSKTSVQAGEYVAVTASGRVARVERLLDAPMLVSPRDLQRIFIPAGGTNGDVTLRWTRVPASGAVSYKVEVATSPFFVATGKVSERDQLNDTEFRVGSLRPGIYYWRVQAIGASGQHSEWCDGFKFTVATASNAPPPKIEIKNATVEYIGGEIYLVRGRAQPGNTVRANNRQTLVASNGNFQLQVICPRPSTNLQIEVEDSNGNRGQLRLALPRT